MDYALVVIIISAMAVVGTELVKRYRAQLEGNKTALRVLVVLVCFALAYVQDGADGQVTWQSLAQLTVLAVLAAEFEYQWLVKKLKQLTGGA